MANLAILLALGSRISPISLVANTLLYLMLNHYETLGEVNPMGDVRCQRKNYTKDFP